MQLMVDVFTAECIWDVLVESCGAVENEINRRTFITHAVSGQWTEFRFGGMLGWGGKVWNNGRFYVTCYHEDKTIDRLMAIEQANEELERIFDEVYGVAGS